MSRWTACLLATLVLGVAIPATAAAGGYRVQTLAEGLDHPWSIAFLPDGRMLVTERAGRLRILGPEGLREAPVEGVPEAFVSGQAGLFEVALDPDFARNQYIYLSLATGHARSNHATLVRGRWAGDRLEDVQTLFTAWPGKTGDAHYGGRIAFLADGTLVMGLGDGFDYREDAQRLDSHIGTLVRIHTDGSVPDDNPFVGRSGALPEIYSYGHRNVQGLVYDASNNRLWSHEHGPRGGDEINLVRAGHNYGWPLLTDGVDYNGALITPFAEFDGMTGPNWVWTPSIAPSGMALYTGDLFPEWRGSLFVSALAAKKVVRVMLAGGRPVSEEALFTELGERIRDVRMGPDGTLYLLTDASDGRVLRVLPAE